MGSMIDVRRPDGGTCKGYLAEAGPGTPGGKPGIVVLQEWWGLNDQIKGVADRFAKAGYNAIAPDLYKGRVTQKPDAAWTAERDAIRDAIRFHLVGPRADGLAVPEPSGIAEHVDA